MKQQHGMTLVELMISMLISLGLIAGISSLFLQMQKSNKIQRSISAMADDSSYVQEVLQKEIRSTGRLRSATDTNGNNASVFLDPVGSGNEMGSSLNLANSEYIKGGASEFVIRYQLMDEFDLRTGDTGNGSSPCTQNILMLPTDTVGIPATAVGDPAEVTHVATVWFYLNGTKLMCQAQRQKADITNTDITKRSQCLKNCNAPGSFTDFTVDPNVAPVEVISNVAKLSLTYGVDSDVTPANPNGDNAANYYVDAEHTDPTKKVPDGRWKDVVSVRLTIVVRGEEKYVRDGAVAYQIDGVDYSPADSRELYKVFTTTIALRNQLI